MVSQDTLTALYISIPVYFFILLCAAIYAYRRNSRMMSKQDGCTDEMTGHYLGGRSFGPVMIVGTTFASLFSGYTVIGIPNESYRLGFYGFRWLPSTAYIAAAYFGTGIRLRKASLVRNHQTPVDFITDRFRSQTLRYTIVTVQVVTNIIYLSAQVNALKSTFNSMFQVPQDDAWPVILIMIIILAFEWAGGLTSVAVTDSIQGIVMILSFIMLPCVIKKHYGGWAALDPLTYPRPDFYQTPSRDQQWLFWQFSLINSSFFVLPHLMTRIYAARDLVSLKIAWGVLTVGTWATMFVGVFIGTVGVQILADAGADPNPPSPFTAILDELMNLEKGFPKFVAVIALTASLAAIMSTADSLIISTSQLVTVECVWPFFPDTKLKRMAWCGRIVSLLSTVIALLIGIFWKEGLTHLSAINFPVLVQAMPPFIVGLYFNQRWDFHPWCLALGVWAGFALVLALFFGYINRAENPVPVNAGIVGVLLQIVIALMCEFFYRIHRRRKKREGDERAQKITDEHAPMRPLWDFPLHDRFGESKLTPPLLNKMMAGTPEPFKQPWYALLIFFTISMVTPLLSAGQPEMDADGNFVSPAQVVRGLPWWFFKQILLCVVPFAIIFVTVLRMPNKYPLNEDEVDKEGIDPEIIELEKSELNRRSTYDERKEGIFHRRSIVREKLKELGFDQDPDEEGALPSKRRLSSYVFAETTPTSTLLQGSSNEPSEQKPQTECTDNGNETEQQE